MVFTLVGGASLCGAAALVLLVISTATDYWMQYRYSGNAANQGLWRFCINRKCHAHTLTVVCSDDQLSSARFSVCCSGFYGLVCGGFCFEAVCVSAGFLALLALAIYTGMTVNFFGKRYIDWRFSWSYILAWVGIILAFGAGVLQLCAYQRSVSEAAPASVSNIST
ncbi:lens fiber membrane intrinsic protein-like [Sinocyclocheilus rhinocerous]|uniref:lens fiber membrane intrinsic protein-like n=1 Tax=Sinocyclocheilus rhinocerous TaxID=307959 RepID=UPI0007B8AAB9|nr:PREDICTED: lens fiber membrane intrinsic protein-like [Sinocyclocheilus rhinocerous]